MKRRFFRLLGLAVLTAGVVACDAVAPLGRIRRADPITEEKTLARLEIYPKQMTLAPLGAGLGESSARIYAEGYDKGGEQILELDVSWRSSDDAIASVDDSGVAVAKRFGQVDIWAEHEDVSSEPIRLLVEPNRCDVSLFRPSGGARLTGDLQVEVDGRGQMHDIALELDGEFLDDMAGGTSKGVVDLGGVEPGIHGLEATASLLDDGEKVTCRSAPRLIEVQAESEPAWRVLPSPPVNRAAHAALAFGPSGRLFAATVQRGVSEEAPALQVVVSSSDDKNWNPVDPQGLAAYRDVQGRLALVGLGSDLYAAFAGSQDGGDLSLRILRLAAGRWEPFASRPLESDGQNVVGPYLAGWNQTGTLLVSWQEGGGESLSFVAKVDSAGLELFPHPPGGDPASIIAGDGNRPIIALPKDESGTWVLAEHRGDDEGWVEVTRETRSVFFAQDGEKRFLTANPGRTAFRVERTDGGRWHRAAGPLARPLPGSAVEVARVAYPDPQRGAMWAVWLEGPELGPASVSLARLDSGMDWRRVAGDFSQEPSGRFEAPLSLAAGESSVYVSWLTERGSVEVRRLDVD